MRLDLLLQREDFPQIFSQSLKSKLKSCFGWSGQVTWNRVGIYIKPNVLRANHKLNVIYPHSLHRSDLRQLTAEYSYHPHISRRLLQSLFVYFATSFPFEFFTTVALVKVEPWVSVLERWCIIPGNHSFRIVECDKNRCLVFLKAGFNDQFIRNEIFIREKFPDLPTPVLFESDKSSGWYTEERIIALPINRIADYFIRYDMLVQAQQALFDLYEKSRQHQQLFEYREELVASLKLAIERLPTVYQQNDRQQLNTLVKKLNEALIEVGEHWVDIVQSHGDFQPANIMVSMESGNRNLYLIDWEYSERRSQFYDALVFITQARFPHGFAKRLENLLSGEGEEKLSWCGYSSVKDWMVVLFFLEDLLVRLQELQIPDLKQKGIGLEQWLKEVSHLQGSLYG